MKPSTDVVARRLKLQHLNVAAAVAQWGSMGKAARHLAVSQPVVSKAVGDLEHLIGVRLFDRSPQGVEPTLYCRALLKRSAAIFDGVRTGIEEIGFLADPASGELRLGSTEPLLAGLVTAAMEVLWQQHPGISLRALQADSATLINRDLRERRIEIAVTPMFDSLLDDELEVTTLYEDTWHVVAGADSPWTRRRRLALADLLDARWCATPLETSIGSLLIDAFRAHGLQAPRLTVSSVLSPQLVTRLLENGQFVAVMSDSLLNHFYAKRLPIKRLPIELASPSFAITLVTIKNRTISPVAQLFIEAADAVAAGLKERRSKRPA